MTIFNKLFPKEEVSIKENYVLLHPEEQNYERQILYDIKVNKHVLTVGECDLRIGMNEELYYAGQIGYRIYSPYRGHHYAYKACELMLQTAKQYHMDKLLITCSPDNIASRKTILRLGGHLLETTPVPPWHYLYQRGETVKEIYQIDLTGYRKDKHDD